MIPLNRPNILPVKDGVSQSLLQDEFADYDASYMYASRDGLNAVYRHLYETKGSLRVAVSPLTCFVALYPIVKNGHTPVFVDVNPQTFNMDEDALANESDIDAVQVIHLGGNPMNMNKVQALSQQNGWIIIEDCAQAFGSTWNDKWVGGFGDYTVFSLVKNLHAAYGGLLLSKKVNKFSCAGKAPSCGTTAYKYIKRWLEAHVTYKQNLYAFLYENLLRFKEREVDTSFSSEIKILNLAQTFQSKRNFCNFVLLQQGRERVAQKIIKELDAHRFILQKEIPLGHSNRNRLLFLCDDMSAKEAITKLRTKGIAANNLTQSYLNGYQLHISQYEMLKAYYKEPLRNYEDIFPRLLSVPCSSALTDEEIEYMIETINKL